MFNHLKQIRPLVALGALALAAAFALSFTPAGSANAAGDELQPGRPAPNRCIAACEAKARAAFKTCVDDGGTQEECGKQARLALQECVQSCPKPERPAPGPGPGDCAAGCAEKARAAAKECVAGGGTPEDCRAKANEQLKECLTACPKPEPRQPRQPRRPAPDPTAVP